MPGVKGGQDMFGAYEPVEGWPKPMSTLPGHEGWGWSTAQDVFPESPDRVFIVQKGELPDLPRPEQRKLPEIGPSLRFPINRLPFRQAGSSSPDGHEIGDPNFGRMGIDYRWEHILVTVDAAGTITEEFTRWDKMFKRAHSVRISPYDPEKHVWVVDADGHAVYKFSNDGTRLLQTLGVPNEPGNDDRHFNQPTFMTWLPDGTFYVADGYINTRVVKFDKDGRFLMAWGEKGKGVPWDPMNPQPGQESRPGYFNNVHGIAVDPETRRVFVNDRANSRVQVFDENGGFLDHWGYGPRPPSDVHNFIITSDRHLWAADRGTSKILKYDLDGNFLYSFGTFGVFPGGMWGVHGMSTDQQGNFYVAEVDTGRVQKYRPRAGARKEFLIGAPFSAAR
jgi:DNA-binding beta-propeller fold protein YncE